MAKKRVTKKTPVAPKVAPSRTWQAWLASFAFAVDYRSLIVGIVIGVVLALIVPKGLAFLPSLPIGGEPAPFAGDGLMGLIVEETEDRDDVYTREQLDVLMSTAPNSVRGYFAENAVKVAGQPAFRVLDKDQLNALSLEQPWVREAAKAVDVSKLPYMVMRGDKGGAKFQVVDTASTLKEAQRAKGK